MTYDTRDVVDLICRAEQLEYEALEAEARLGLGTYAAALYAKATNLRVRAAGMTQHELLS